MQIAISKPSKQEEEWLWRIKVYHKMPKTTDILRMLLQKEYERIKETKADGKREVSRQDD